MSWESDSDGGERVDPRQEVERLRGLLDVAREDLAAAESRIEDLRRALDKSEERVGAYEEAVASAVGDIEAELNECFKGTDVEQLKVAVEQLVAAHAVAVEEAGDLRARAETALRVLWDDARVSERDLDLASRAWDPVAVLKGWREGARRSS